MENVVLDEEDLPSNPGKEGMVRIDYYKSGPDGNLKFYFRKFISEGKARQWAEDNGIEYYQMAPCSGSLLGS